MNFYERGEWHKLVAKTGELIRYIRADGESINLHSPPNRAVANMTGWGYPAVTTHTVSGPFQHGESLLGYRFQPRTISLEVMKTGCSRTEYFAERSRLISLLGLQTTNPNLPELGRLQWEYIENDTYKTRAVDCYINRGLKYESDPQWFKYGILESLEFVAPDPVIYDPIEHVVTVDTFTEYLTLPMTFPFMVGAAVGTENLLYDGTWESYPIIEITGPTNGFKITNQDTGISIELDYFINVGITVTFNLLPNYRTVTDNLGNNLISKLKQSNLAEFSIVGGSTNTMLVYVSEYNADTEVVIRYYSKYVGI
jgi:hypothetical protein